MIRPHSRAIPIKFYDIFSSSSDRSLFHPGTSSIFLTDADGEMTCGGVAALAALPKLHVLWKPHRVSRGCIWVFIQPDAAWPATMNRFPGRSASADPLLVPFGTKHGAPIMGILRSDKGFMTLIKKENEYLVA